MNFHGFHLLYSGRSPRTPLYQQLISKPDFPIDTYVQISYLFVSRQIVWTYLALTLENSVWPPHIFGGLEQQ